jgi:hypothetical protein
MREHGMNVPLRNTEGNAGCNAEEQDCNHFTPTVIDLTVLSPRSLFVMAAKWLANFDYYSWETQTPLAALCDSAHYETLKATGEAYQTAVNWLHAKQVTLAYACHRVHVLLLRADCRDEAILWASNDGTRALLPEAWAS